MFDTYAQPCDVDGDGKLDLVGYASNTISVWRGHGDGTFDTTAIVTSWPSVSSGNLTSVYIGDFTGDGRCDILSVGAPATWTTSGYTVASGQPDATFVIPTLPTPWNVSNYQLGNGIVANLNSTNKVEVVIAAKQDGSSAGGYFELPGATFFGGIQVGMYGSVGTIAAGDVLGNGSMDVVEDFTYIGVGLRGIDGGPLTGQIAINGTAPSSLVGCALDALVYDLDGDGYADIGAGCGNGQTPQIFWGDPSLALSSSSPFYLSDPGDFDGDGHKDLVMGNAGNPTMCQYISFGDGTRNFAGRTYPLPAIPLNPIDIDGDGASDLVSWQMTQNVQGAPQVLSIYLSTAKHAVTGSPDIQCGSLPADQCTGPLGF